MKNKTLINLLLDRSGSMRAIQNATVDSINTFIREQKKLDGDVEFSLYQFDDPISAAASGENFPQVVFEQSASPHYTPYDYRPRGNTSLIDAACKTIDDVGQKLANTPEKDRPDGVAFVIITDGLDNRSEKSKQELKKRIEHQRDKYNWKFYYLGAGHDTVVEGASYGIAKADTQTYEHTDQGVVAGVRSASAAMGSYRSH